MAPTIVWFRQDLRLRDNPAITAARKEGGAVLPIYILDDAGEAGWRAGAASRWWLHQSLASLAASLEECGSRLLLARGDSEDVLGSLVKRTGAQAVFWNRRYEPHSIERDKAIKARLLAAGVEARSFNSALLFEPQTVRNKEGAPFQVFTPFWNHCLTLPVEEPGRAVAGRLVAPPVWPASSELKDLALLPDVPWTEGIAGEWAPGETSAHRLLHKFTSGVIADYAKKRDFPDLRGTSCLSPHLHFGEIGPRQIWTAVRVLSKESGVFPSSKGAQVFLKELGWREFSHHLLYHFPQTPHDSLRRAFAGFPWQEDASLLQAWQKGVTGYPIVDAGMRQLWRTGWMHNRVRMIVASFLVKHLRLPWQSGAAWFWDTLVDADLANNTFGWQWAAGCGADAAPYFRIFNPTLQGRKFDPAGSYVRRWLPELGKIPDRFVHEPWEAPPGVLHSLGITLGREYPQPIVNHGEARLAALAAFQSIRGARP